MSYYQGLNLLGLPTRGKPEFNLLYTILLLKKERKKWAGIGNGFDKLREGNPNSAG